MKNAIKILTLALICSYATAAQTPLNELHGPMDVASPPQTKSIEPLSQQNLYLFGTTLEAIREYYVTPVTDDTIVENAVQGMLSYLDPHSAFLDQDDFQDLQTLTNGSFSGVGVEITPANGALLVITPVDDSPAQKAGIKAGDYIVKVNGVAVEGLSVPKAMNMMRGPKGEKVTLTIVRKGEKSPLNFVITRDDIVIKDVKTKVYNEHYGYIRISEFQADTGKHVANAVQQLYKDTNNQLYGVVLDLRNNPGGVVEAATATANVFLDVDKIGHGKYVVYTKGRMPESSYEGFVTGHDQLKGLPVIVLINAGSASAAEIVTGALQDYNRAVVVGIRSFGKGSVQTVFPLQNDKTAIKLTTALYYTPNGREIQALGITPDVLVNNYNIPDTVKPTDQDVIREGDLAGHLNGGDNGKPLIATTKTDAEANETTEEIINPDKDKKPLFYSDYQLDQALELIAALHATTPVLSSSGS